LVQVHTIIFTKLHLKINKSFQLIMKKELIQLDLHLIEKIYYFLEIKILVLKIIKVKNYHYFLKKIGKLILEHLVQQKKNSHYFKKILKNNQAFLVQVNIQLLPLFKKNTIREK
jgi:hypothetical protein